MTRYNAVGVSIQSTKPTYAYGQLARIPLRPNAAHGLLRAALPADIPVDALVTKAELVFTAGESWTTARTISAQQNSAAFTTKTTWNSRPAATGTVVSTSVANATSNKTTFRLNVAAHVQSWLTGATVNRGWRLTTSANATVLGSGASVGQPWLDLEWVQPHVPPFDLAPAGGATALAQPTLTFGTPPNTSAVRVQIASDAEFTTIVYDSGQLDRTAGVVDLAATAYSITDGETVFWRAAALTPFGWTDYSDIAELRRDTLPPLMIVSPEATAGDVTPPIVWSFAQVAAPVTNLWQNPSFETTVTWTALSGSTTPARVTDRAYAGTYSLRCVRGAGTSTIYASRANFQTFLTTAGEYTIRLRMWVPSSATGNVGMRVSGTGTTLAEVYVGARDTWAELSHTFTWDGAGTLNLYAYGAAANAECWIDAIMLTPSANASTPYFDGDTADTATYQYAWTGTPHASTSTRTSTDTATQTAWQAKLFDVATGVLVDDSKRQPGAVQEWTPSKGLKRVGDRGRIEVHAFDDVMDRVVSTGDPGHAVASHVFTVVATGVAPGVDTLDVAQVVGLPLVDLAWTFSGTQPDEWLITRNGEWVARVDGTVTSHRDATAPLNHALTYRVVALSNGQASTIGPSVTLTLRAVGVWLVDPDDMSVVVLLDAEQGTQSMPEQTVSHDVIQRAPVRRRLGLVPPSGAQSGRLADALGVTADECFATLMRFKTHDVSHVYRLLLGDWNVPVTLGEIFAAPTPNSVTDRVFVASFAWWQTDDELPWAAS